MLIVAKTHDVYKRWNNMIIIFKKRVQILIVNIKILTVDFI